MKKILSAIILLNMLTTPVLANTSETVIPEGYHEVIDVTKDDNVKVYNNNEGDFIAVTEELPTNGSVLLYDDGLDRVWVDIENEEPQNPSIPYGDTGWSGGSLPSGTSVLTPNHFNGYIKASYQVSVTCYPPRINYAVNPSVTGAIISLSNVNLSVPSTTASGGVYAVASMTFDCLYNEDGWTGGSRSFYLTTNINSSGKTLISWNL
ncbi:hypothetical protein [Faecalibaculum rodentium]|jgi:hypothetical protein|uniref:hypothetical protein n=1 Tax=Faecalibaculum rodentium TaxID=1702221 RepID=UPI00248BDFAA|nr:hypothetical protein [Faecalibaculum rodentium]